MTEWAMTTARTKMPPPGSSYLVCPRGDVAALRHWRTRCELEGRACVTVKTWRNRAVVTWESGGLPEGTTEALEARSELVQARLFSLLNHFGGSDTRLADCVDSPSYFDVPVDEAESLATELTSFMERVLREHCRQHR